MAEIIEEPTLVRVLADARARVPSAMEAQIGSCQYPAATVLIPFFAFSSYSYPLFF